MFPGCCDDVIMSSDVTSNFGGVVDRLHWCMLFFCGVECISFFVRSYLYEQWMYMGKCIFSKMVQVYSMDVVNFVIFDDVLVGFSGLFYSFRLRPLGWKVSSR